MWVRRAFFRWLIPAAFVLPLWLVIGWSVFHGGWTVLWVVLIAAPSVFAGQLLLALLTRSRASVRAERAVSWLDVAGFALWHGLTIAVGFASRGAFGWFLVAATIVGSGLIWLQFRQLWSETRGRGARIRDTLRGTTIPRPGEQTSPSRGQDVIVIQENDSRG